MAEIFVFYSGPIVTVDEARATGEKRYFTGKPCANGHIQQRVISSNGCLTCDLNRKKKKYNPAIASENKKRLKVLREAKRVWKPGPPNAVFYEGPVITREDALRSGLKRYFLGMPCGRGHISQRQTVLSKGQRHGQCVKCAELSRWKLREKKAGRPRPSGCDICGCGQSSRSGFIVYDHCHRTGKFRGWLCNDCNAALGFAKDSPHLLRKMAKYLEKASGSSNDQEEESAPLLDFCAARAKKISA